MVEPLSSERLPASSAAASEVASAVAKSLGDDASYVSEADFVKAVGCGRFPQKGVNPTSGPEAQSSPTGAKSTACRTTNPN